MLESLEREVMILGNDLGCDLGRGWIRWDRRKDINMDIERLKSQNVDRLSLWL